VRGELHYPGRPSATRPIPASGGRGRCHRATVWRAIMTGHE